MSIIYIEAYVSYRNSEDLTGGTVQNVRRYSTSDCSTYLIAQIS